MHLSREMTSPLDATCEDEEPAGHGIDHATGRFIPRCKPEASVTNLKEYSVAVDRARDEDTVSGLYGTFTSQSNDDEGGTCYACLKEESPCWRPGLEDVKAKLEDVKATLEGCQNAHVIHHPSANDLGKDDPGVNWPARDSAGLCAGALLSADDTNIMEMSLTAAPKKRCKGLCVSISRIGQTVSRFNFNESIVQD